MSKKNTNTTADFLPWAQAMLLIKRLYEDGEFRMSLMVGCGCFFGFHISDLLELTWEDVLTNAELSLRERERNRRQVILVSRSFLRHIEKCRKALLVSDPKERCFLNRYGVVVSRQMVNRKLKWYKVKYRLPIENFSTHTFRKTWARKIYENELESGRGERALLKLSELMNHSSSTVTKRYIGLKGE